MFSDGDIYITSIVDKHEYTIKLSEFTLDNLPDSLVDSGVIVCDVTLFVKKKEEEEIGINFLMSICYTLYNFIINNNVVLYYYCSNEYLNNRHCVKQNIPPQRYRHNLFSSIFKRYVKPNSLIEYHRFFIDSSNEEHYLVLISKPENKHIIDIIGHELDNFEK